MVRWGVTPDALIARSASITSAALQPLSRAPVPSSQESRCAPRMTNSSGASLPRISATTFESEGGPTRLVGKKKTPPQDFPRRKHAGDAFAVLPGHDHHGKPV